MPVTSNCNKRRGCAETASMAERKCPYSARVPVMTSTLFLTLLFFFIVAAADKLIVGNVAADAFADHGKIGLWRQAARGTFYGKILSAQTLVFAYCPGGHYALKHKRDIVFGAFGHLFLR